MATFEGTTRHDGKDKNMKGDNSDEKIRSVSVHFQSLTNIVASDFRHYLN